MSDILPEVFYLVALACFFLVCALGYYEPIQSLVVSLAWKFVHRKGCGRQQFIPLRREALSSCRILTLHGRILEITDWDVRAQCPFCGRVHRFTMRSAMDCTAFLQDDE